ncbi:hypothetical protein [Parahaliea mediterranea]|uniref:PEP-CTERM sorting domain-containing protein n=1 Tax=Parahaliea mediterranea TaxID=651086 RepID=A0A939ILI3_9GAMM|nr:hypothetical protein [Parahaliea mediterranea]MBN7796008.1 hypothetical protein [Parahaliea mediterranea]
MRLNLTFLTGLAAASLSLGSANLQASLLTGDGACTTDSVHITSVSETGSGNSIFSGTPGIAATACAGMFAGANDDAQGGSNPDPNIGQLGDGFMNGQVIKGSSFDYFNFISPADLQDRDGDGNATDPGWVHLAHVDGEGNTAYSTMGEDGNELYLGDILNFAFCLTGPECSGTGGTWSLDVSEDSFELVTDILGPNAFDHLTFVFKAGSNLAVYDFDFTQLANGTLGINFTTAYSFEGTWNTGDFTNHKGNAQAISHMSVWARDPALPTRDIPLPSSLLLLMAGGLMLVMRRR